MAMNINQEQAGYNQMAVGHPIVRQTPMNQERPMQMGNNPYGEVIMYGGRSIRNPIQESRYGNKVSKEQAFNILTKAREKQSESNSQRMNDTVEILTNLAQVPPMMETSCFCDDLCGLLLSACGQANDEQGLQTRRVLGLCLETLVDRLVKHYEECNRRGKIEQERKQQPTQVIGSVSAPQQVNPMTNYPNVNTTQMTNRDNTNVNNMNYNISNAYNDPNTVNLMRGGSTPQMMQARAYQNAITQQGGNNNFRVVQINPPTANTMGVAPQGSRIEYVQGGYNVAVGQMGQGYTTRVNNQQFEYQRRE